MEHQPGINLRIISDNFHSGILLTNQDDVFRRTLGAEYQSFHYVFYAFADRAWFLENQQEWHRIFPTLFSPTEGIVERVLIRENLDLQYLHFNKDELGIWSLEADIGVLDNILRYIEHDLIEEPVPVREYRGLGTGYQYSFFPAGIDYHLFWNCHHFILASLEEAGYPVSSDWFMFLDSSLRLAVDGLAVASPP
jgi:hypothetical protein